MQIAQPWLDNYPADWPRKLEFPEEPLYWLVERAAKMWPEAVGFKFLGSTLTYSQLDELSSRFARGLQDLGVKKGDRVALYLPNSFHFIIAFYGALKAGAIVVPHNPIYKEKELKFQLNDSGSSVVIGLRNILRHGLDLFGSMAKVLPETKVTHAITGSLTDFLPPLKRALAPLAGVKQRRYPGTLDFLGLIRKSPPSYTKQDVRPREDPALILYTGGTTGTPKGAVLTHYNLLCNAIQVSSIYPFNRERDVALAVLPFFHSYGLTTCLTTPIYNGVRVVILPRYDTLQVMKTIQREKVTLFPGVPLMYNAIINHPKAASFNLRSVRACISGAAALPEAVARRFMELTGGQLVEGYGLSEASPVTHVNPLTDPSKVRLGSIGFPVPGTEAAIVDLDDGKTVLPPGQVGELIVRGPQVMKGYWNRPEETRSTLRDGWLHTGDIAKMDEQGYFYIIDRVKDMINVAGLKVWPREVEEVLYQHEAVKEAAVVPIPDSRKGEVPKAYVVLKEGYRGRVTAEELIAFVRGKLADYKVPREVEFRDDLPKTLIGKVLRRALREEAKAS